MKNHQGFHLVEVLFTLAIISITAALSYPVYSDYMMYTRRMEAENTLTKLALAMEKFRVEHQSYENATLNDLHFPDIIVKNHYRLAIQQASNTSYVLTATPLGKQTKDDTCATLSLNAKEEKGITGNGSLDECWA
jgi:type IV pilus assembly protein PilE